MKFLYDREFYFARVFMYTVYTLTGIAMLLFKPFHSLCDEGAHCMMCGMRSALINALCFNFENAFALNPLWPILPLIWIVMVSDFAIGLRKHRLINQRFLNNTKEAPISVFSKKNEV